MKSDKQNPYTMHNSNFITFSFWVCMFPFRSVISIWGISTYRLKTHPNQLGVFTLAKLIQGFKVRKKH